jgi:glycine cleavage system aminomethyltransferase T
MGKEREALEQAIRAIGNKPEEVRLLFNTERGEALSLWVEAEHALAVWTALREHLEETGYWPVIMDRG